MDTQRGCEGVSAEICDDRPGGLRILDQALVGVGRQPELIDDLLTGLVQQTRFDTDGIVHRDRVLVDAHAMLGEQGSDFLKDGVQARVFAVMALAVLSDVVDLALEG